MSDKTLPDSFIRMQKLKSGEKIICSYCGKGVLLPVGGDCKKAHCFVCDKCGKIGLNIN